MTDDDAHGASWWLREYLHPRTGHRAAHRRKAPQ
jgi:hypothetical protein